MPSKKNLLIATYFLVLSFPVITWVRGYNSAGGLYEFMRLAGLLSFTMMSAQLTIGAFMLKLRPIFGTPILKLHIVQGMVAFSLALLHPLLYAWQFGIATAWNLAGYYNWGKVGLAVMIFSVSAGLLRTAPFLMRHWRWVHRLNYLLLAIIYIHSWNVGTDVRVFPMLLLYWLIPPVFLASIYSKLRPVYNSAYGNR